MVKLLYRNRMRPTADKEKRTVTEDKLIHGLGVFLFVLILLFVQACSTTGPASSPQPQQLANDRKESKNNLQPYRPPAGQTTAEEEKPAPLKVKFKELSPLDSQKISASFTEESYRPIFQILARAAGLNLVLAPELESLIGANKLTAEYQEIKVRTILDAICAIFDVSWREEHSTLFIEPFVSKTIHLDFISEITQSSFSVGGDVLGGGSGDSEEIYSPLTGRFEIAGQVSDTVTDIYTNIEETVGARLENNGEFLLNRQTGTLMIRCRPRLAKEMESYLDVLRKKYSKQVLIEAQIIEVSLSESQQLGIDWQNFSLYTSTEPIMEIAQTIVDVSSGNLGTNPIYNVAVDTQDYSITAVFTALQEFGNLKVLSNPRIKTMNGQSAAISVGQSVSYLRSLTRTTEISDGVESVDISTEIGAVFDGILLGVTPVIKEDNSVSLHIVPIKSEIVSLEQESLGALDAYSVTFPVVNLREISTIINVRPKNVVVLGGLIMERENEEESGLPILGDLPFVGRLFKQVTTAKEKVELVVILKIDVLD